MYIDAHTHSAAVQEGVLAIRSHYREFLKAPAAGKCSVGIHPWYTDNYVDDFPDLIEVSHHRNVLAIGECGLDKACKTSWPEQLILFRRQITLANDCGKPLIIHCVRAFDEVLLLLREALVEVPVVFHGFRNKQAIADSILARGYYLSFGAAILHEPSTAADVLRSTPPDRFFLETDDSDVPIQRIYEKAAQLRNVAPEALILQLEHNYSTVFKQ